VGGERLKHVGIIQRKSKKPASYHGAKDPHINFCSSTTSSKNGKESLRDPGRPTTEKRGEVPTEAQGDFPKGGLFSRTGKEKKVGLRVRKEKGLPNGGVLVINNKKKREKTITAGERVVMKSGRILKKRLGLQPSRESA